MHYAHKRKNRQTDVRTNEQKKKFSQKKEIDNREIVRKEGRYKEECVIKYIFKNLKINICAPLNFENLLSLKEIIAKLEI